MDVWSGPYDSVDQTLLAVNVPCRFVEQTQIQYSDYPFNLCLYWVTCDSNYPGPHLASGVDRVGFVDFGAAFQFAFPVGSEPNKYILLKQTITIPGGPTYYRYLVSDYSPIA